MKWTDTSSYSRGERGQIEPTAWTLEECLLSLVVHRYHGCDGWFYSVRELALQQRPLVSTEIEAAKEEAIGRVALHLAKLTKSLERATQQSSKGGGT